MGQRSAHPQLSKNLVLIGGRGCGKSSIAKRLARANRHFVLFSLDGLVRYEAGGVPIPEIVEREGWPGFRARELAVVERVAAFRGGALIDAGGGVVVELSDAGEERYSERKVAALRRHGRLFYLRRPTDYLERRIADDAERPRLSAEESFRRIMKRRDPWYRRAAHHVIECDGAAKNDIAETILDRFYEDLGLERG